MDANVLGVSADAPQLLAAFREKLGLPYTLLSDPQLQTAELLGTPVSSRKGYTGSLVLHPEIRKYPKKAFLQPAVLVWRPDGALVHRWHHTEKITNLYGARGRPSPDQIVEIARTSLG